MVETFTDIKAMRQVNARFGLKNTPVIRVGDLYFCSGLTALDLETGEAIEGGTVQNHARVTLGNLSIILGEVGLDLDHVVKLNAYLADPVNDFAAWNEVYLETFQAPYPARTTVGAGMHVGILEIDVIAAHQPRR
ncbi:MULTISPECIES: RidA family protein [unclassified Streptomyces]|uniref:RidA family protein n=1 Tax=unclassified Streptomyces TaxID=2593676 RepID=UPI0003815481|nr:MULTISPECIES: RidA family protein [unclassified Streptomyces]MYT33081.1 hypothetical protein [Streptomyces sp. SID8354]